jgi:hypothetical protein
VVSVADQLHLLVGGFVVAMDGLEKRFLLHIVLETFHLRVLYIVHQPQLRVNLHMMCPLAFASDLLDNPVERLGHEHFLLEWYLETDQKNRECIYHQLLFCQDHIRTADQAYPSS